MYFKKVNLKNLVFKMEDFFIILQSYRKKTTIASSFFILHLLHVHGDADLHQD
jgi:hypothetical protein